MPKLVWVLLPLAAVAAWLALCAWRGRMPARTTLNVLFSLLLLGYVAGTAGLGVFWVAHQQLPVFDWHYTFGYATVVALLVHLGFNLRVVWHHLRQLLRRGAAPPARPQRPAAQAPAAGAGAGRRPLLGLGGAAALLGAAGLGYLVGLRHGRTELLLAAGSSDGTVRPDGVARAEATGTAAAAPGIEAEAWAVVERFHAFSAHSRTRVLRHAASPEWGGAPPAFKRQPGGERLPLPAPAAAAREGEATGLAALSTWLWHTAGISEWRGGIAFRTAPSSGALFATELYVRALDAALGLPPGSWWHYDAESHALRRLRHESTRATANMTADMAADTPAPPPAPAASTPPAEPAAPAVVGTPALPAPCHALVVATAVFARSGHKYGDRTYRYVLADLGHALENLRRAAAAHGRVQAVLLPRFDEAALAASLALDERQEGVLAAVALVPQAAVPAGNGPGGEGRATSEGSRWTSAWRSDATAQASASLGLTEAVHRATSLRALPVRTAHGAPATDTAPVGGGAAEAGASARAEPAARPSGTGANDSSAPAVSTAASGAAPGRALRLPQPRPLAADPLPLIARRRSQRRVSAAPLAPQVLADVLGAMTSPRPQLSQALRIDVVTTAVAGVPAASWRVEVVHPAEPPGRTSLHLLRRVDHDSSLRRRARAAALDQDVIGDAAVVFVLSLDRATLRADPAGAARGYRHGFIEAGLVGERLYLAAAELGLGACAVGAFHDDEAAALAGLDAGREWPVHFAALGLPA